MGKNLTLVIVGFVILVFLIMMFLALGDPT